MDPRRLLVFLGHWIALLIDHARPIRVTLIVIAIGTGATFFADQVNELYLIAFWTDPTLTHYNALLVTTFAAACAVWYQTRTAYRMDYPRWPNLAAPEARWLRVWLPRVLGAAVPLLVAAGTWLSFTRVREQVALSPNVDGFAWRMIGLCSLSAIGIVLAIGRRELVNWWLDRRGQGQLELAARPELEAPHRRIAGLGKGTNLVFLLVAAANFIVLLVIQRYPNVMSPLGPLALLLLSGTFFCITAGYLVLIADRWGLPVLSLMFVFACVLHALHLNDNHHVRLHPGDKTTRAEPPRDPRRELDFVDYRSHWLSTRCEGAVAERPCVAVFVSAEGGGIRAAAWTAMVLSRLEHQTRAEARRRAPEADAATIDRAALSYHVFAASGVSGGSLGLATYVGLLPKFRANDQFERMDAEAQAFLDNDFLAPTLASMLFTDFTQRLVPGRWVQDRGRALTRAWETHWPEDTSVRLDAPFGDLYTSVDGKPVPPDLPALFFNSTVVGSGERFVQHPFTALPASGAHTWAAAINGSDYLTPEVPLSEVVLNSARFTYVSPAGTVSRRADRALRADKMGESISPDTIQVVDGGYFENSGATTLQDIIDEFRAAPEARDVKIVVIHLSNDPSVPAFTRSGGTRVVERLCDTTTAPIQLKGEVTAPLEALLATRTSRGVYARDALVQRLRNIDELWHFRLCQGKYPIPLGWTISAPIFEEMRQQLDSQLAGGEVLELQ